MILLNKLFAITSGNHLQAESNEKKEHAGVRGKKENKNIHVRLERSRFCQQHREDATKLILNTVVTISHKHKCQLCKKFIHSNLLCCTRKICNIVLLSLDKHIYVHIDQAR